MRSQHNDNIYLHDKVNGVLRPSLCTLNGAAPSSGCF